MIKHIFLIFLMFSLTTPSSDSIEQIKELLALASHPNDDMATFSIVTREKMKISSASGFIVNVLHLRVLTQKELKSNFVYTLMIGICICDIILLSSLIREPLITFIYPPYWSDCHPSSYFLPFLHLLENSIQETTRKTSSVLAFLMALIRTLSVMFPTNGTTMTVSKPIWAVSSIIVVLLVFGLYDIRIYFYQCKIISYETFCQDMDTSLINYMYACSPPFQTSSDIKKKVDGVFTITLSVLYLLITIALLYQLRIAKNRRKSLKSDKSESNTSMLVVIMTITFFLSALAYVLLFVNPAFNTTYFVIEKFWKLSQITLLAFFIFNSYVHCLVCLFMSSQYRSVARKLFWFEKQETITVEGVQSVSITNTSIGTTSALERSPKPTNSF